MVRDPASDLGPDGDPDAEIVHVVPGGDIHPDPECPYLARASQSWAKDRAVIDEDRICSRCAGTTDKRGMGRGKHTNATRRKLAALDPDDVGLSPLGDRGDRSGRGDADA